MDDVEFDLAKDLLERMSKQMSALNRLVDIVDKFGGITSSLEERIYALEKLARVAGDPPEPGDGGCGHG